MASLWFEEMWEMSVSSVLVRQLEKQQGGEESLGYRKRTASNCTQIHRTQLHRYTVTQNTDRKQMRTRPENANADGPTSDEAGVLQAQTYLI